MIRIAETIQTDVLVVGAGGAGLRAALEAQAAGAHTLLVAKGKLGRSGTTSFEVAETAGYNAADGCIGSDSPAHHYQDIIDAALGTCDPELARILAEEAPGPWWNWRVGESPSRKKMATIWLWRAVSPPGAGCTLSSGTPCPFSRS